jgi:hypothetical protein
MLRRPCRPHPAPELLALLEETMLFVIQLLIARHPDLLAAPEELDPGIAEPPLRAAHRMLDALREVTEALDDYRHILGDAPAPTAGARDDNPP